MSKSWAARQRHTNRMVRALAKHVLTSNEITPDNLYGLSKLAWITNSYEGDNPSYISSTKIPALGDVLNQDFSNMSLDYVATRIAQITGSKKTGKLVKAHSGFTNLYKAYRNSSRDWFHTNHEILRSLFLSTYNAVNDEDRFELVQIIEDLPGVPKANHPDQLMRPEYLLTPALFSIDPEIKFPLINGNEWVKKLLSKLQVTNSSLTDQFSAMSQLIGLEGIDDAADLDQVGRLMPDEIADLLSTKNKKRSKKILSKKQTGEGKNLSLKDEADVEAIKTAGTVTHRNIHNKLTNQLRNVLQDYLLLEGEEPACMFDVLVKNYDGNSNDLLIEAKSSNETAHVRMAIGQLFHYRFVLEKETEDCHLAILLPETPSPELALFLEGLQVGILWLSGKELKSNTCWLQHLVKKP